MEPTHQRARLPFILSLEPHPRQPYLAGPPLKHSTSTLGSGRRPSARPSSHLPSRLTSAPIPDEGLFKALELRAAHKEIILLLGSADLMLVPLLQVWTECGG